MYVVAAMDTLGCSLLDVLIAPFDVVMDLIGAKASTFRQGGVDDDEVEDHPVHTTGMMRLLKTLGH